MRNIIAIALLFVSSSALAADGVGPAGCGLGNLFFGKDAQIAASTTNGSSGTQTFGITSGTSNCVDAAGTAKLEAFIEGNRVAFESEAARGQGETVESLAQILQCPNAEKVGGALKSSHNEIFATPATPAEMGQKVREVLKANQVLCLSIG